jgi:hypothetical protein
MLSRQKAKEGFIKSSIRRGCFHYFYRIDCFSSASTAVYINRFINDIEVEEWYKRDIK